MTENRRTKRRHFQREKHRSIQIKAKFKKQNHSSKQEHVGEDRASEREREADLDTMLETVKLPAGIADLDTGLTDVDRDALSHFFLQRKRSEAKEKMKGKFRGIEEENRPETKAFIKTPPSETASVFLFLVFSV